MIMAIGLLIWGNIDAQTFSWYNEIESNIETFSDYYLLDIESNKFLGENGVLVDDANLAKNFAKDVTPLNGYAVISSGQYNAVCPQQFIRKSLKDNNVNSTAWYNYKEGGVTYGSWQQEWHAAIATGGGNGIRMSLKISGLRKNGSYTLGLGLSCTVESDNSSYDDGALHNTGNVALKINKTEVSKLKGYQDKTKNGSCKHYDKDDQYEFTVSPNAEGEILIEFDGTAAHEFARINYIKDNDDIVGTISNGDSQPGSINYSTSLESGAYKLIAEAVSQNNPSFLYANIGGQEQKLAFCDNNNIAKSRELTFIVTENSTVNFGCRYTPTNDNTASNFRLYYLGDASNVDLSSQIVNANFDIDNENLDGTYGWKAKGNKANDGRPVFSYKDFHELDHGVAQIYNGTEDVNQTITGLPNGWYQIDVQGFYRDAGDARNFKNRKGTLLYGNNAYSHIMLINDPSVTPDKSKYPDNKNGVDKGGYPDDLEHALQSFNEGNYSIPFVEGEYKSNQDNEVIAHVTDHTLKIGFLRPEGANTNGADWTVLNNVKLHYLGNATSFDSGRDLTQFIMNPSFESATAAGWTVSTQATFPKNENLMTGADGSYIANTGKLNNLDWNEYRIEQEIGGTTNGLVAGTYAIKAKVVASPNTSVTATANGQAASYNIASATQSQEIVLGGITIDNNEKIKMSFSSSTPFSIDNVRLYYSNEQSNGSVISADLADKYYLYNVEAGSFLGHNDVNSSLGWNSKAIVGTNDYRVDLPWEIKNVTGGIRFIQNTTLYENRGTYLYVKRDQSIRQYGIGLWIDGREGQENESSNIFDFVKDATGYYTIGVIDDDTNFGSYHGYTKSCIGWSGENTVRTVIPLIPVGDKEPRGIHWIKMSVTDYNNLKATIKAAHPTRMEAWPVLRSAKRTGIAVPEFEKVYNDPRSTSQQISTALVGLRKLMAEKSKDATATNYVDFSFYDNDLDCQQYASTIDDGTADAGQEGSDSNHSTHNRTNVFEGWTNNSVMFNFDQYMFHTTDAIFGSNYYEMWSSQALGARSLTKTISDLPAGFYSIAVDILGAKGDSRNQAPTTGVKVFISNNGNERYAECTSTNIQTIATDFIEVHEGDVITLGVKTDATTDAMEVKFDNFKLRYCGPLYKVIEADEQKTIVFNGTWATANNGEMNNVINAEGAGVTVDLENTSVTGTLNIALDKPKNVLVYAPEGADITINGSSDNVVKGGRCTKFIFYDGQSLNITKEFKANNVIYDRPMKSLYATVVLPVSLKTGDDYTLYTLDGIVDAGNGDKAFSITRKDDALAPNVPVILKRKPTTDGIHINVHSDEGYDILPTKSFPSVDSNDGKLKLVGSYVYDHVVGVKIDDRVVEDGGMTYAEDYYYISSDEFIQGWDYFYCDTFRAYIDASVVPLNARPNYVITLQEVEVPTGIHNTDNSSSIDACYSVNGTRISTPHRGLNIIHYSDGSLKKVSVR